jgi:hypothetical protein
MLLLTFLCVEHWVRLPVLALILTHIRRWWNWPALVPLCVGFKIPRFFRSWNTGLLTRFSRRGMHWAIAVSCEFT